MPEKAGRELVAKSDPARIPDESSAFVGFLSYTQRKSILRERENKEELFVHAREVGRRDGIVTFLGDSQHRGRDQRRDLRAGKL